MRHPRIVHRGKRLLTTLAGVGLIGITSCETIRSSAPSASSPSIVSSLPKRTIKPKKPGGGAIPPLRVSRFVFHADVPLNGDDVIFRELETLPDQIERELRVPTGTNLIQVYLFATQDHYEAYMADRHPDLQARRAYFVGTKNPRGNDDLVVYTWMGEHLRTDLRHELTHALLNGGLATVPLWLDEGLAGFFEQPPTAEGVNRDHLDKLTKEPCPVNLRRLEAISEVQQMGKPEYQEAWAWTHYMLRGDAKAHAVLLDYMQLLRTDPDPGSLLPRLAATHPDLNSALMQHLNTLRGGEPTIRVSLNQSR